MRNIETVLNDIIKIVNVNCEEDYKEALVGGLKDIIDSSHFAAPETQSSLWVRASNLLILLLVDTNTKWKQDIDEIFNGKIEKGEK